MPVIDLKYGRTSIPFEFLDDQFEVLFHAADSAALTDAEIGEALDRPIDSQSLDEIVRAGERVLLVVPDATRQSGCAADRKSRGSQTDRQRVGAVGHKHHICDGHPSSGDRQRERDFTDDIHCPTDQNAWPQCE